MRVSANLSDVQRIRRLRKRAPERMAFAGLNSLSGASKRGMAGTRRQGTAGHSQPS